MCEQAGGSFVVVTGGYECQLPPFQVTHPPVRALEQQCVQAYKGTVRPIEEPPIPSFACFFG
jgi:hypothetical protein